jgi:type I restriction enzyme S subunit
MLDGLKPYPAYKESGVPWLGRIPENWSVARNGRLFSRRNEPGTADLSILEVSLRTGVRVRELGGGGRKQLMADIGGYRRAVHGDIAYNTMRMWQGAVGVVPATGLVSPAYVVARPHADAEARYFTYLFRTGAYLEQIDGYSRGIVKDRNRLYWEDFKGIPSPVPAPEEQQAIVRFLHHVERRTRRYVRARNRLIELIKERKAAIIAAAMTKGLNPTARREAAGLLWLGEIPEGWTLKRLKFLARIRSGQVDPREPRHRARTLIAPNHIGKGSGQVIQLQTAEEQGADSGKYEVRRGEIIYSKIRPALRKAAIAPVDCLCSADMYPITVDGNEIRPEFFLRILLSEPFTRYAVDSSLRVAMPKVNREALGDFWVRYPALEVQDEIVHFIAASSEPPDLAVTRVELVIGLVDELLTRLIADVVTGKLDVREAAAKLPEESIAPDTTEYDELGTETEDDADDGPDAEFVGREA